jgi:hypothetical protein
VSVPLAHARRDAQSGVSQRAAFLQTLDRCIWIAAIVRDCGSVLVSARTAPPNAAVRTDRRRARDPAGQRFFGGSGRDLVEHAANRVSNLRHVDRHGCLRIYACGGPERRMIVVSVSATP